MKNRPEMLMSRCDDEDESASSQRRVWADQNLAGGCVSQISCPRVPTASTYKKGPRGGASTGEAVSLASPGTWRRTGPDTKVSESFTPPEVGDGFPVGSLSRRAGLEGLLANPHLNVKVNRSAVAPATGSRRRGAPLQHQTR